MVDADTTKYTFLGSKMRLRKYFWKTKQSWKTNWTKKSRDLEPVGKKLRLTL